MSKKSKNKQQEIAAVNIDTAFNYLEFLLDNPDAAEKIPDGATVIVPTGVQWVDEQNQQIGDRVKRSGGIVYLVESFLKRWQKAVVKLFS